MLREDGTDRRFLFSPAEGRQRQEKVSSVADRIAGQAVTAAQHSTAQPSPARTTRRASRGPLARASHRASEADGLAPSRPVASLASQSAFFPLCVCVCVSSLSLLRVHPSFSSLSLSRALPLGLHLAGVVGDCDRVVFSFFSTSSSYPCLRDDPDAPVAVAVAVTRQRRYTEAAC